MKRWLQEPLLHFLVIGAVLFVLFYRVAGPESVPDNRIIISEADIDRMISLFERKLHRPPTQQELNGLVQAQIREEVLYREALAMNLDKDDTIVRRRMAQKVEFMFNDIADAAQPTDEEIQQFLDENPDKFIESARTSFNHIYLDADKRGDELNKTARQLLEALNSAQNSIDPATLGDPFMFGYSFDNQSGHQVSRMFGADFVQSLDELDTGNWQDPVASGYGLHLVQVKERTQAWLPPLEEIRDSVLYELLAVRRQEINQKFFQSLRDRYDVRVEQASPPQSTSGKELAQ